MPEKTLDQEISDVVRSLSEERKRHVLDFLRKIEMQDVELSPTREQLWALAPEERTRRIQMALKRTQQVSFEDLEGYTDDDFDDGTAIR